MGRGQASANGDAEAGQEAGHGLEGDGAGRGQEGGGLGGAKVRPMAMQRLDGTLTVVVDRMGCVGGATASSHAPARSGGGVNKRSKKRKRQQR